ncbi:hypothetical protein [Streptomyces sp. NBC_01803]|uniref:hypothetical protein n=1 Tax=Streptomyces sp. NBC_01803 TaxID=2975946 RepID=UPI002DD860F2|nr:hypothetical protein [Streptomyces sp. NBC_01803]WSA43467.1 hypothetical protein OIE51_04200 [Streptomyces sp. NBC_01803]
MSEQSSDLPPDLPRLRTLATWLELQLGAVREAITEAERVAAAERARPRWWVQWTRTPPGEPRRGVLHRAGCWCPGEPDLHPADVRRVVVGHAGRIETCLVCRAEVPPTG